MSEPELSKSPLPDDDDSVNMEEFILLQIGIKGAQEQMRQRGGPEEGETVSHPTDRIV